MTDETTKLQEVLELAECLARLGGYRNFSMRRVANETGNKTSNLYDHFGSKEQLAIAVVRRFGDRVFARVGPPDDPSSSPEAKLDVFIDVYRQSITDDGQVCLFLVFGAELHTLPPAVQREVNTFYNNIFNWLETLFRHFAAYRTGSGRDPRQAALALVAALNGAQICVRAVGDRSIFESVVKQQYDSGIAPGRRPTRVPDPKA